MRRGHDGSLEYPYTNVLSPAPTNPKASDFAKYLPNATSIMNGAAPVSLGVYDRQNKLPYSINYTLDIQWQPRNDLAFDFGYVGNLGRHQVVPVPFNQPNIASPAAAVHSQNYSYGYTPTNPDGSYLQLGDGTTALLNFEGGNIDLRVPYIGYAAESITYKAAGVSAYNALQVHVDKRISHGLQVGASYTYSHALDEQSALGLFYNGNNPSIFATVMPPPTSTARMYSTSTTFTACPTSTARIPGRAALPTDGRWWARPFCRADSLSAWLTLAAALAASTTVSTTASPIPSCR